MEIKISIPDMVMLLSFAARTVEIDDQLNCGMKIFNDLERSQWDSLRDQTRSVLARVDLDNPSIVPVPHDGIPWRDR